jgi:hypothetical protein
MAYTSSAAGTTPSAGTHTITVKAGASAGMNITTFSPSLAWVRVEPVGL